MQLANDVEPGYRAGIGDIVATEGSEVWRGSGLLGCMAAGFKPKLVFCVESCWLS